MTKTFEATITMTLTKTIELSGSSSFRDRRIEEVIEELQYLAQVELDASAELKDVNVIETTEE